jgi:hypothetical protein
MLILPFSLGLYDALRALDHITRNGAASAFTGLMGCDIGGGYQKS